MIQALYDHMEWADAIVWRTVVAAPADETVRAKQHHIHLTQHAFLSVWSGNEPKYLALSAFSDNESLIRWGRGAHDAIRNVLADLDESQLGRPLDLPWARRVVATLGVEPSAVTLEETLMQLPQHSTYHRGQVNLRLRQLGVEPPLTDFIAWAWLGKPEPEWP
jgi:uncharacterized damage-inducible protein DinB